MSHVIWWEHRVRVNPSADDPGETYGDKECLCPASGLCPVSAGELLKAAHLENDMCWRRRDTEVRETSQEAIYWGDLREMEMKSSSISNTTTKPFLILQPPFPVTFRPSPLHTFISGTSSHFISFLSSCPHPHPQTTPN